MANRFVERMRRAINTRVPELGQLLDSVLGDNDSGRRPWDRDDRFPDNQRFDDDLYLGDDLPFDDVPPPLSRRRPERSLLVDDGFPAAPAAAPQGWQSSGPRRVQAPVDLDSFVPFSSSAAASASVPPAPVSPPPLAYAPPAPDWQRGNSGFEAGVQMLQWAWDVRLAALDHADEGRRIIDSNNAYELMRDALGAAGRSADQVLTQVALDNGLLTPSTIGRLLPGISPADHHAALVTPVDFGGSNDTRVMTPDDDVAIRFAAKALEDLQSGFVDQANEANRMAWGWASPELAAFWSEAALQEAAVRNADAIQVASGLQMTQYLDAYALDSRTVNRLARDNPTGVLILGSSAFEGAIIQDTLGMTYREYYDYVCTSGGQHLLSEAGVRSMGDRLQTSPAAGVDVEAAAATAVPSPYVAEPLLEAPFSAPPVYDDQMPASLGGGSVDEIQSIRFQASNGVESKPSAFLELRQANTALTEAIDNLFLEVVQADFRLPEYMSETTGLAVMDTHHPYSLTQQQTTDLAYLLMGAGEFLSEPGASEVFEPLARLVGQRDAFKVAEVQATARYEIPEIAEIAGVPVGSSMTRPNSPFVDVAIEGFRQHHGQQLESPSAAYTEPAPAPVATAGRHSAENAPSVVQEPAAPVWPNQQPSSVSGAPATAGRHSDSGRHTVSDQSVGGSGSTYPPASEWEFPQARRDGEMLRPLVDPVTIRTQDGPRTPGALLGLGRGDRHGVDQLISEAVRWDRSPEPDGTFDLSRPLSVDRATSEKLAELLLEAGADLGKNAHVRKGVETMVGEWTAEQVQTHQGYLATQGPAAEQFRTW